MELLLPNLYGFALVLFRVVGLVGAAPVFGSRQIPARVKMAMAVAISTAVFLGAGSPQVAIPSTVYALAGAAVSETLIGLFAGTISRMALDSALAAGQIAGLSMGLSYGSMIDPFNGAESTAVSQLLSLAAMGMALAAGLHREAIAWLAASVRTLPPGGVIDFSGLCGHAVLQAISVMALSVRLAFPVLAVATFGHLAMGAVGRVAPQLNLMSIGFSISILAGGGALFLVAPAIAQLAAEQAVLAFSAR